MFFLRIAKVNKCKLKKSLDKVLEAMTIRRKAIRHLFLHFRLKREINSERKRGREKERDGEI